MLVEYAAFDMEKRSVVADENASVRHALRSILELEGDWKVDGEALMDAMQSKNRSSCIRT
jgi:hypothetical protein